MGNARGDGRVTSAVAVGVRGRLKTADVATGMFARRSGQGGMGEWRGSAIWRGGSIITRTAGRGQPAPSPLILLSPSLSMSSFPLLNLPPEVLHAILDRFLVGELFHFSQSSRKALNIVKERTSSYDPPLRLYVSLDSSVRLSYPSTGYDEYSVAFSFYGEPNVERFAIEESRAYDFDGQVIEFCRRENGSRLGCANSHSTADVLKFARYLKNAFNANLESLGFSIDDDVLEEALNADFLRTAACTTITEGRVSHEEMSKVLDHFQECGKLHLWLNVDKHFVHDKTISNHTLEVNYASWFTRKNLLNVDCVVLRLRNCQLKSGDFNAFLHQWMESEDKKLQHVDISGEYTYSGYKRIPTDPYIFDDILKGLPVLPGVQKRQEAISVLRRHYTNEASFETGMDLRRESDGVLATVMLRKDYTHTINFFFVVWQEPDPNVAAP